MTGVNSIGLIVCVAGITLHVILKAVFREKEMMEPKRLDESVMSLIKDGVANMDDDDDDEDDIFNVQRDR
jgi:mannose/fructose-specific phosphotransferase system component IIA